MSLAVREVHLFTIDLHTRIPFRYGIATMTDVPHLVVRAAVEIDGRVQHGFAADQLPPKWFTKNPETPFADDVRDMKEVIRHAAEAAPGIGEVAMVFEFWRALYAAQREWAAVRKFPPLLWNFGVSLVERACIDAFCRATSQTLAAAVRNGSLGIDLGAIHPELAGTTPAQLLPAQPLRQLKARHTVGLTDPVTDAEIPENERVHDGLPHSLEQCIARYGLTHFKIKLSGNVERDRSRLLELARLLAGRDDYALTLDGNENYRAVAPFRALWEELRSDPAVTRFLEKLIVVEQPLHRDLALSEETAKELLAWHDRPPLIIDESDSELPSVRTALASGYVGTSHKNCKGVFRGIAAACLIESRRRAEPQRRFEITGEDLVNVGPIALLQDLAVVATLGITHVERNGHHYLAGLSQFPQPVQREILAHHGDLYEQHPAGFPTLRINRGTIEVGSLVDAPFGVAFELPLEGFTAI